MSDNPASPPSSARPSSRFSLRRTLVYAGTAAYCLVLFLAFDFAWSSLSRGEETQRPLRIANPVYDHGLAAGFDGHDVWGETRHRLVTNSLGFKDASARTIQLKPASRRVLLIGDSFAEGIGMSYEDSFAGLLQRAGQQRNEKIEFLNAGVASYSPVIYYKKIKYLLELGLQFDEVVVFSDTSDVTDEANFYFCIDDDPKYRAHCTPAEGSMQPAQATPKQSNFLIDRFVVTNRVRITVKRAVQSVVGNRRKSLNTDRSRIGWTVPGLDVAKDYQPLGVEGGIARSLQNMRALSDLLAAKNIPLTIVVYPWAQQVAQGDRDSKQVSLWRDFCEGRCKAFINLYPVLFAASEADKNWYERYYIVGDDHFSAEGNQLVFRELARQLL
jgi:hypothetical protein